MPAPGVAASLAVSGFPAEAGPPMSNGCATVDAMDRQTAAITNLANEVKAAREAFTPAAEAISDLGSAQKKLCAFLVGNRLKLAASVPLVLTFIGAVSPNVAHALAELLKVWGVQ